MSPNPSTSRARLHSPGARIVVVMGVSGCGKSTIAEAVASRADWLHLDADAFHPQSNIDKMSAGVPLTDDDRFPWLECIRGELDAVVAAGNSAVLACSALKRTYRDVLRSGGAPVRFAYLRASKEELVGRISGRGGHFFPAALLDSQFAALEEPGADEDCSTLRATDPIAAITAEILAVVQPADGTRG